MQHHWPGNVRELENIVERAANLVSGNLIEPDLFGLQNSPASQSPKGIKIRRLVDIEKQAIIKVMDELGYNLSKTSQSLGISRATLYNKIKRYNLPIKRPSV